MYIDSKDREALKVCSSLLHQLIEFLLRYGLPGGDVSRLSVFVHMVILSKIEQQHP